MIRLFTSSLVEFPLTSLPGTVALNALSFTLTFALTFTMPSLARLGTGEQLRNRSAYSWLCGFRAVACGCLEGIIDQRSFAPLSLHRTAGPRQPDRKSRLACSLP